LDRRGEGGLGARNGEDPRGTNATVAQGRPFQKYWFFSGKEGRFRPEMDQEEHTRAEREKTESLRKLRGKKGDEKKSRLKKNEDVRGKTEGRQTTGSKEKRCNPQRC